MYVAAVVIDDIRTMSGRHKRDTMWTGFKHVEQNMNNLWVKNSIKCLAVNLEHVTLHYYEECRLIAMHNPRR